jgi:uncharacterized membrane protein
MEKSKEGLIYIIIFTAIFLLTVFLILWANNSTNSLLEKIQNIQNTNQISEHNCTKNENDAQFCSMEYSPVCDNTGKTHSNGCWACASDATNWSAGECS